MASKERLNLIHRFDRWLDSGPSNRIISAQCASIAEEYASRKVLLELEAIEAKFPYNCAIEDYGWIWVDLKNRIAELTENKMEQDLPLVIEDFRIGFEYEELQLDSNRYLNKGMIWVKKVYGFSSPRLHKMNVLLDEGKLRNIIKQK